MKPIDAVKWFELGCPVLVKSSGKVVFLSRVHTSLANQKLYIAMSEPKTTSSGSPDIMNIMKEIQMSALEPGTFEPTMDLLPYYRNRLEERLSDPGEQVSDGGQNNKTHE
jgi:hypothetical protein